MSDFIQVFTQNIVPIFLVATVGFILRARLRLSKRALSSLTFYAFSPALVFTSLVKSELPGSEFASLAGFTVVVVLAMGGVALLMALLMRASRQDTIALVIVIMFVNAGNYGLTLNNLRYGEEGLSRAVVYYIVGTILVFTLGILIASMGQASWRESLRRLIRLPAFYAVVVAIIMFILDIQMPSPVMSGIEILAAGAIPAMLVVLGMQIADLGSLDRVWLALPASLVRLLVAPVVAVGVAALFGLTGVTRSTAIIEASMPTAVITTILATEFNVRPGLVTSTVVLSTLLSAITLPLVITVLGL